MPKNLTIVFSTAEFHSSCRRLSNQILLYSFLRFINNIISSACNISVLQVCLLAGWRKFLQAACTLEGWWFEYLKVEKEVLWSCSHLLLDPSSAYFVGHLWFISQALIFKTMTWGFVHSNFYEIRFYSDLPVSYNLRNIVPMQPHSASKILFLYNFEFMIKVISLLPNVGNSNE